MNRRRNILLGVLLFVAFLVVGAVAFITGIIVGASTEDNRIAFSWGDSIKYNKPAFYGAEVYFENAASGQGVDVFVKVAIGSDHIEVHMPERIGHAATSDEARRKWRKIEWTREALLVGEGPDRYVLPRTRLESHR